MHQSVVANLQASKGSWGVVARDTGISRRTIEKIASGEIEDPRVSNIEVLHKYFAEPRRHDERTTTRIISRG